MSIAQMRIELIKAYPGPKWEQKVKKMSDAQVVVIFNRLRLQGIIKL